MRKEFTDLVGKTIFFAREETCDKAEQTFAAVDNDEKTAVNNQGKNDDTLESTSINQNISQCIRIQNVLEYHGKKNAENFFPTKDKVTEILKY